MTRPVVLVHGAWHGAWAWDRVLPLLAAAGVEATAIDLPGHGADLRPLGDLPTDAEAVRSCLDRIAGAAGQQASVVLVGHSYGGAVVTEVGAHPGVGHLVFLAGFPLDEGESCASAAVAETRALDHRDRPDLGAGLVRGPDGSATLDPGVAAACLYGDCDDETVAWALARLGPHRLAALTQQPSSVGWRSRPSTYIVCSQDMTVHPDLERVLARRCTTSVEWDTGHSPFLSRPELVADLLVGLAREDGP